MHRDSMTKFHDWQRCGGLAEGSGPRGDGGKRAVGDLPATAGSVGGRGAARNPAAVERTHAQRLVIDSLSGFELALAPTFRADFRESLYRMVGALTGSGVTVFMTAEVAESFTDLRFSADLISFLTDDVIFHATSRSRVRCARS